MSAVLDSLFTLFQSTLSMRRATTPSNDAFNDIAYFNPRSP